MNKTTEDFFTEKEALGSILEFLENATTDYYVSDLQNYIFNEDYYIIGIYQAEKALNQYGVFDAIREIQDYEKNEFGEVTTDLSIPEDVANMLEYIIGTKVMDILKSINKYYDNKLDDKSDEEGKTVKEVIIDEVNSRIKDLQ